MYLEKILTKNFRNLEENLITLNPNINLFIGNNGQGKTNLLEAIYLLSTGTSHRTNVDSEMINWHKEKTLIQIKFIKQEQQLKISLLLDGSNKKIEINDNPIEKISDLIGNLNTVLFSPEDLTLVKGGPAHRRNFIDLEISQVSPYYYHISKKYNHILKQRNNLLKEIRNNRSSDKTMLDVWDKQLSETGSKIIKKRLQVITKLKILARLQQRQITEGNENLSLSYKSSFHNDISKVNQSDKNIKLIFDQHLVNNRNKEIERGYTLFGPHRDDIIFKINEIDVRKYGSQGQQRTVALALKLAELEFMKSETGEYPLLLLDDVFSELDGNRRNTLIETINNKIQTFITTTDYKELNNLDSDSAFLFKVNSGKIEQIDM